MTRLLPIFLTLACSGGSDEDTGESPSGDTAGDTAETDTIPITATFVDGVSGSPIVGAEICTVVPENDDPCETTDGVGSIEWQQVSLAFSNVLNRMTHPDYMTTLYAGRYDQGVHDGWMAALETSDSILIDYWAFQTASVEAYLSTGDAVNEEGHGIVGYWLLGADGSAVNGAVITVENAAGEAVGDVLYGAGMTNTIDTDLTATSIAGNVTIANIPPGEYTFRVTHETLTCEPGFSYSSAILNVTTVPVEADSQTLGNMFCYTL